jgi:hypothetical protein
MIREAQFRISRNPYAVNLSTLHGALDITGLTPVYRGTIDAVWYRRRKGGLIACMGQLWDFQSAQPVDAEQFLARLTDGRSGGRCHVRWNGTSYWADDEHRDTRDTHLAILQPMLADFPQTPAGYDGWWRF